MKGRHVNEFKMRGKKDEQKDGWNFCGLQLIFQIENWQNWSENCLWDNAISHKKPSIPILGLPVSKTGKCDELQAKTSRNF